MYLDDEALRANASLPVYRRKIDRASKIIEEALKLKSKPMVAFSCGKDSSVLAHMVMAHKTDVPLRFLSSGETRIMHNVDDVIRWFTARGADMQEIHIDRLGNEGDIGSWEKYLDEGKNDFHALNIGKDLIFMGLRMDESNCRRMTLKMHQTAGYPPYCYTYAEGSRMEGMVRCCPLAEFSEIDIATYLHMHDIPMLAWYQKFGIEARTTARIRRRAVQQNVLFWIKASNPSGFARLVRRFPEFGFYV